MGPGAGGWGGAVVVIAVVVGWQWGSRAPVLLSPAAHFLGKSVIPAFTMHGDHSVLMSGGSPDFSEPIQAYI